MHGNNSDLDDSFLEEIPDARFPLISGPLGQGSAFMWTKVHLSLRVA
jgi:hypothetical protein